MTLWPFPENALRKIAANAKSIIVPEMNWGQIVREVERILHRDVIQITQVDGEGMRPDTVLDGITPLMEVGE